MRRSSSFSRAEEFARSLRTSLSKEVNLGACAAEGRASVASWRTLCVRQRCKPTHHGSARKPKSRVSAAYGCDFAP
jgi:hypothetical protein